MAHDYGWEWGNGMIITSDYGSFPHSLLSTSKMMTLNYPSSITLYFNQEGGGLWASLVGLIVPCAWQKQTVFTMIVQLLTNCQQLIINCVCVCNIG